MTFAATHPRGERKVSRWLSRASGGALLRLCLPFEEICFALFHFLKAPCLGKNKTARGKSLWRWSRKLYVYRRGYSIYLPHSTQKWIFIHMVFSDTADRTPVCKRECNEDAGKCKGIFLRDSGAALGMAIISYGRIKFARDKQVRVIIGRLGGVC